MPSVTWTTSTSPELNEPAQARNVVTGLALTTRICNNLRDIPASAWNALVDPVNPFLRHEFLAALEQHDCVGQRWGWIPQHVLAYDEAQQLVGAMPLYLKDNSYGELVFDSSWADAYHRHGLAYYPKLVSAVPYTPVTGSRLLCRDDSDSAHIKHTLAEAALGYARHLGVSSLHVLFPEQGDLAALQQHDMLKRVGVQFHWHNDNYASFDAFLAALSSKKRKQLRQERRRVQQAGIEIEILDGHQAETKHWQLFHEFYCSTFYRKSGYPTLSLPFFETLAKQMPEQVVLIMARQGEQYVAGAFNLRGSDTLFGRHWGCSAHFDMLHFEVCYYAAIDYCIANGLARFEAGAQGEHKLSRGFLPVNTYSAHWLAEPAFHAAIADFVEREQQGVAHYTGVLAEHSPFKRDAN